MYICKKFSYACFLQFACTHSFSVSRSSRSRSILHSSQSRLKIQSIPPLAKRRQRNLRDQLDHPPQTRGFALRQNKRFNDLSYTSYQCIPLVLTVGYRRQAVAGGRPRTRINKLLLFLLLILVCVVFGFRQLIFRVESRS